MEVNAFLTLYSYDERFKYAYFVGDNDLRVLIHDRGLDEVSIKSIQTEEDWKEFLDIFEEFYCHEEGADQELLDFLNGLEELEAAGIPSKVIQFEEDGNADVFIKAIVPIALYFRQDELNGDVERNLYWLTDNRALKEIQSDRENLKSKIKQLDTIEQFLKGE